MVIESLTTTRVMPENKIPDMKTQEAGKKTTEEELKIKKPQKDEEKLKINPFQKEEENPIDEKTLPLTIGEANKRLAGVKREFQYSVHEETNQIMVKIMDKETKEVIREVPSEKTLDMIGKIWEMAGILVDERTKKCIPFNAVKYIEEF